MNKGNIRWRILVIVLLALFLGVDGFAKSAEDWYREGVELSLDDAQERAVQAFHQALSIKPEQAEFHHALGVQYFKINSGLQGITHLRKAARLYQKRSDPLARKNLVIVKNNLEKAYARLNVDPDDFDTIELDPGFTSETQWQSAGTGFLIGGQGFLLTPHHILEGASNIRVRFSDGKHSPATIVKSFVIFDLAILRLEDATVVPQTQLSFGNAHHLKEGDSVFWIDQKPEGTRMVQGPVLTVNALGGNTKVFYVGLPLQPGQSGGPLLNALGEVVGMVFSQQDIKINFALALDVPQDTSFALKSSYIQSIASDLIKSKQAKPGPEPRIPFEESKVQDPKFHLNTVAVNVVLIETSQTP